MADTGRVAWPMFARLDGRRGLIISLLLGAILATGQAPTSAFWLAVPAICAISALATLACDARHAARLGLWVGIGFAAVNFIWIVEPFLVDLPRHGWMAPFALVFMSLGVGLFWSAAFWAVRRLAPARSLSAAVLIPVFWTAVELVRSYALTGFPWGLTGYIWIDTPIYQLAAYLGPHGLTFFTVLLAAISAHKILQKSVLVPVICLAVLLAAWTAGVFQQSSGNIGDDDSNAVVRLVQPNASQEQKWDPEMIPVFFQRQLDMTALPGTVQPDLVIWPEVAVPFLLNEPGQSLAEISAAAGGRQVVIGAQRFQNGRAFNSLALIGTEGQVSQVYDKHHLVPFGEYLPAGGWLNKFGFSALTAQYGIGYSAGPGPQVLDFGALGRVLPLICYEAIFPHEMRQVERPDWMLLLTNDAWFGQVTGPFQHLAQAKARAIEFGLPMVRVANTGVSGIIDARGNIVASIPLGSAAHLDGQIPDRLPATTYWRFGDIPAVLLMIVVFLAALALNPRNSIDRSVPRG